MAGIDFASVTDEELKTLTDGYVSDLGDASERLVVHHKRWGRRDSVSIDRDQAARLREIAHDLGQADGYQSQELDPEVTKHHDQLVAGITGTAQEDLRQTGLEILEEWQPLLSRRYQAARIGPLIPWWVIGVVLVIVALVEIFAGKPTIAIVFGSSDAVSYLLAVALMMLPLLAGFALVSNVKDRAKLRNRISIGMLISLFVFFASAAVIRAAEGFKTDEESAGGSVTGGSAASTDVPAAAGVSGDWTTWAEPLAGVFFALAALCLGFFVGMLVKNWHAELEEAEEVPDNRGQWAKEARYRAVCEAIANRIDQILSASDELVQLQESAVEAYISGLREYASRDLEDHPGLDARVAEINDHLAGRPKWYDQAVREKEELLESSQFDDEEPGDRRRAEPRVGAWEPQR